MSNNEKITPPPELVREWAQFNGEKDLERFWLRLATQAARWGYEQRGAVNEAELQKARDEELDACCQWVGDGKRENLSKVLALRAARRPKPPSLKEQALEILNLGHEGWGLANDDWQTLRRALEALPE